MVWIPGVVVILDMAGNAVGQEPGVNTAAVTFVTGCRSVGTLQCKAVVGVDGLVPGGLAGMA